MKNQVIKVLNKEHGKKVIKYWKDRGVDTRGHKGSVNEADNCKCIYYGVINGRFENYSLDEVRKANAEIIDLPKEKEREESVFKVGDKVYHYAFNWGIIKSIEGSKMIQVEFKKDTITFIDGLFLSFTKYTLQGFSQERPIEIPEAGELCLFYDDEEDLEEGNVFCGRFQAYKKEEEYPYKSSGKSRWAKYKRIKILD